ncbi:MAG: hypothetical protein QXN26_00020 [Thermoplasmataceae archaeon]
MQNSDEPVMMDLAFMNDIKGRLFLFNDRLVFESRRDSAVFPITTIEKLAYEKKTFVTSTLFVNDLPITVCRAHIWAARMVDMGLRCQVEGRIS